MLQTRAPTNLYLEVGGKRVNHGIQNRDAGNAQFPTSLDQDSSKVVINNSEEHGPGIALDPGQNLGHLTLGPDQSPDVLDRLHTRELNQAGPCHRIHGFSRGIRNQVHVMGGHLGPSRSEIRRMSGISASSR